MDVRHNVFEKCRASASVDSVLDRAQFEVDTALLKSVQSWHDVVANVQLVNSVLDALQWLKCRLRDAG